jgi:hypothetical protein
MLRGLVTDTRDGVRQIAHALDEATTALRVGYVQELRRRLVPGSSPATVETAGNKGTHEAVGLVVIERGRGELYRAVERGAAGPGLTVIWDRRRTDRRRSARRPLAHERPPRLGRGSGSRSFPVGRPKSHASRACSDRRAGSAAPHAEAVLAGRLPHPRSRAPGNSAASAPAAASAAAVHHVTA